jgi:hypothetical protein
MMSLTKIASTPVNQTLVKPHKPSQVVAKDKNPEPPTTARQTPSEKPASVGMPSTAVLLASNNIEVTKPPTVSTAENYQSWNLEVQGNELLLTIKGEKNPIVVRTGDPKELKAIQELFKPEGVEAYEANQWSGNNCGLLAAIQNIMLNHPKDRLIDLIKAVGYNPKNQSWSMTYYDKNDKPKVYNLPKKAFSSIAPPMINKLPVPEGAIPFNPNELPTGQTPLTPEELNKLPVPEGAIPFNPNELPTGQRPLTPEGQMQPSMLVYSRTHQPLHDLINGTLGPFVYDDLEEPQKKGRTPNDPKNLDYSIGLLQNSLNPSVKKTARELSINGSAQESFTAKQLTKIFKENRNITITVGIVPYKLDEKGNPMKTDSGEKMIDTELKKKLEEIGILSNHAYSVVDANEDYVTVVDPYNSSKAIVLDATSLFFHYAYLAKNPTTDNKRIATAPSPKATA